MLILRIYLLDNHAAQIMKFLRNLNVLLGSCFSALVAIDTFEGNSFLSKKSELKRVPQLTERLASKSTDTYLSNSKENSL